MCSKPISTIVALALVWNVAVPACAAQTQPDPAAARFMAAANAFSGCLKRMVQMGMTTKMEPAKFKAGLDASCKPEEARFRTEAIGFAKAQGRTEAEAAAEIDGNIANGRRVFAADQESYVRTGKVPR